MAQLDARSLRALGADLAHAREVLSEIDRIHAGIGLADLHGAERLERPHGRPRVKLKMVRARGRQHGDRTPAGTRVGGEAPGGIGARCVVRLAVVHAHLRNRRLVGPLPRLVRRHGLRRAVRELHVEPQDGPFRPQPAPAVLAEVVGVTGRDPESDRVLPPGLDVRGGVLRHGEDPPVVVAHARGEHPVGIDLRAVDPYLGEAEPGRDDPRGHNDAGLERERLAQTDRVFRQWQFVPSGGKPIHFAPSTPAPSPAVAERKPAAAQSATTIRTVILFISLCL